MDQSYAVEVFRNMLDRNDVVRPDEETFIGVLLSSDETAVNYFVQTYLDPEGSGQRRAFQKILSYIEWNDRFHHDLFVLSLWAQYLANILISHGVEAALNAKQNLGFAGFRELSDMEKMRGFVTTRSRAVKAACDLRDAFSTSKSKTKGVASLLKRKTCH